jgi:serine/threonine-protein kinase
MRGNKIELIHRDVSPHNVIVGVDGTSRLIDFGIAKAASCVSVTNTGVVKGKLRYMSPEQVQRKPLDRRADVFSAGVVLYEALTGRRPFAGDDEGDIVVGVLIGEVPPPSSIVEGLPAAIDDVVEKALARRRDERFATAAEFQEALERALPPAAPREVASAVEALGGRELEARREGLRATLEGRAVTNPRRSVGRKAIGVLAACTILGVVLVLALVVRSRARAEASAAPTASLAPEPDPTPSASPDPHAPASAPPATAPRPPRRARPAPSTDLHRRNPYGAP